MSIGTAFVCNGVILVYDMTGKQLCWLPKANGLHGYTNATVSVRHGSNMIVFDEHGQKLYSVYSGGAVSNVASHGPTSSNVASHGPTASGGSA